MAKEVFYKKDSPRLTVKFIDGNTDELILEVNNKSWMDVGDLLTDRCVDSIIKNEFKDEHNLPENIMVLVVGEFSLNQK